jgi:prepilin-type N-terminal cleavage/methylation domain-containing protein
LGNRVASAARPPRAVLKSWRSNGFSLLELLVTCSLVAIVVVLALPVVGGVTLGDPLAGSAARIAGLVDSARATALRTGTSQVLSIDSGNGRLWYGPEPSGKTMENRRGSSIQLPAGVRLRRVVVARAEPQGDGPVRLWVSRRGTVAPAVLELTDRHGKVLRLTVHALFPTVDIVPGDGASALGPSASLPFRWSS